MSDELRVSAHSNCVAGTLQTEFGVDLIPSLTLHLRKLKTGVTM